MAKLLVHEHSGVREYELLDAEVHIGRELDNTLRLPDPSVSRHHCVVRSTEGGFEIQDLQSSNGVLINGSRVQASPLRDGDRITLGQLHLTFSSPQPQGATVAMQMPAANPLGTVRMTADQMAAIHAGPKAPPPAPEPPPTAPLPMPTREVPSVPAASAPTTQAPHPAATQPSQPQPPAPPLAPMAAPGDRPEFGHFTGQTAAPSAVPAFLHAMLPPIPDPAVSTGPGELGPRIVAGLLDSLPLIALGVVNMVFTAMLVFSVPMLIPLLSLGVWALSLAYAFLFMPLCIAHHGGTWGKKVMKLRVVPAGQPNGRLTFGRAALHQLNYLFWPITIIMVAANSGQGIGNMAAESETIGVDR